MGRPRKAAKEFEVIGADPVLRDDKGLSPADENTEPLNRLQIEELLKAYIAVGVRLKVMDKHWFMAKDKLAISGSLQIPSKSLIAQADYLIAQCRYVESIIASGRRAKKLGLSDDYAGMGQVIGKDDLSVNDI